jgi:hypothetical protein
MPTSVPIVPRPTLPWPCPATLNCMARYLARNAVKRQMQAAGLKIHCVEMLIAFWAEVLENEKKNYTTAEHPVATGSEKIVQGHGERRTQRRFPSPSARVPASPARFADEVCFSATTSR